MMGRLAVLWMGALWAGLALGACSAPAEPAPESPAPPVVEDPRRSQLAVFEELDRVIREDYVYADFGGVDWDLESSQVRHRIESGLSQEQFGEALAALIARLPEGTATFLTRQQRLSADFQATTTYEGIGAFVSMRTSPVPRMLLLSVIEDSPAAKAGLQAHDAVLAVDGQPVTAEEGLAVIERVRGAEGTEVLLEVVSPHGAPREVAVRRGRVTAQDAIRGGILFPGMLYVLAPVSADGTLAEATARLLRAASEQEEPVLGLVLDLRIAGTGGGWPLTEMLALLSDGEMGSFVGRDGEIPISVTGQDVAHSQSIPLAILIGPDTNGSPELFAAAMQANGRATLVGLPTSGSILTFQQKTLSDGSQLTYADSTFVTLVGKDLSLSGLVPTVPVDADWDQVDPSNDEVIFEAVNWLLRGG